MHVYGPVILPCILKIDFADIIEILSDGTCSSVFQPQSRLLQNLINFATKCKCELQRFLIGVDINEHDNRLFPNKPEHSYSVKMNFRRFESC